MNASSNDSGTVRIPADGGRENDGRSAGRQGELLKQSVGPYTLTEFLGRGGMALVFKALDEQNNEVALKLMEETPLVKSEMLERFRREAETAQSLSEHPSVLTVRDTGCVGTTHYIVMDLVPGGTTLDEFLQGQPLPEEQALRIAVQLAEALAFAHSHGIIHRDVKPSNVLINPDGKPLLADFGVAHLESARTLTMTSASLGTPEYMAPEQTMSAKVDERADVYSFGVVCYKMFTGCMPYDIPAEGGLGSVFEVIRKTPAARPRKRNSDLSRSLEAVLLKLIEKDPAYRYADMETVLKDLYAYQNRQPVSVHVPTFFERTDRLVRAHKLLFLGIFGGLICFIGLWSLYNWRLQQQKEHVLFSGLEAASSRRELQALKRQNSAGDGAPAGDEAHWFYQRLEAARNHVISGDTDAALRVLQNLLPQARQADARGFAETAQLELARLFLARREYRKAAKEYREMCTRSPGTGTAAWQLWRFELGVSYYMAGSTEQAEEIWTSLLDRNDVLSPIAYLCRSAIGTYTPDQIVRRASEHGRIVSAWGHFMAANKSPRKFQRRQWMRTASKQADEVMPWLVHYVNRQSTNTD